MTSMAGHSSINFNTLLKLNCDLSSVFILFVLINTVTQCLKQFVQYKNAGINTLHIVYSLVFTSERFNIHSLIDTCSIMNYYFSHRFVVL